MLFDRARPSLDLITVKPLIAAFLLLFQTGSHPEATPQHLRFHRAITSPPLPGAQACAVLDASVFAHAASSLKDLRIFAGAPDARQAEVPYAITLSEPLQQDTDEARILNLGLRSGHIVFDLAMPHRPYTAVDLDLDAHNFIATAAVSGSQSPVSPNPTGQSPLIRNPASPASTSLGTFTLFDLTAQHLSHSTTLPLTESNFPYLHVDLSLTSAPDSDAPTSSLNRSEIVRSATIPPSREAQTLYTVIQQTSALVQHGHESIATFAVPARVPIERIAFTLPPSYKGSFSRAIRVEARVLPHQIPEKSDASTSASTGSVSSSSASTSADLSPEEDFTSASTETATGTILSVHKVEAGREISEQDLTVPTAVGANMQHVAELQVIIENGDDAPLPIAQVQLQMRQRLLCFDPDSFSGPVPDAPGASAAIPARPLTLYYGDPTLEAPVYDYAKLFQSAPAPSTAVLGPESPNPTYIPRTDTRPFTERHPELLWIVLLAVVCILALTAFRSAKRLPR